MDKHLRPSKFDTEPNSLNAEKEWNHWYRTFCNFLRHACPTPPTPNPPDPAATEAAAQRLQQQKHDTLIVYISASIYDYIADAATYEAAIEKLESLYVKPRSIVFNRHKLATTKQNAGETVDQYMQTLETKSRNCDFTEVTAEVYRQEYVRDAFINGLTTNTIRQRLLENNNLSLAEAFQQARTLELAQKQSDSYTTPSIVASTKLTHEEPSRTHEEPDHLAASKRSNDCESEHTEKCFFCGRTRHPRLKCPARQSTCDECGIKGHWAAVCKRKQRKEKAAAAVTAGPHLAAVSAGVSSN